MEEEQNKEPLVLGGGKIHPFLQLGSDPGFAASTLTVPGSASFASGVTASSLTASTLAVSGPFTASSLTASTMAVSGSATLQGGVSLSSGLQYDFVSGLNNAGSASTASSQSMSASGSLITMTSGLSAGSPHVIYVSANSTSATCTLTPTSSASTSGVFQNGVEITVVNLGVSGSRIVIPVSGAGSYNTDTIVISGGHAARFVYSAPLQTWVPLI